MNNNGFYALAFDEGGYAEIPWWHNVKSPFTICVGYINDELASENGNIIEIGGFLSLAVRNGEICLNNVSSNHKLLSECFAVVYIVYDGQGLKLYAENASVYEGSIKPQGGNIDGIAIGRGLKRSYIRSVTIYDRAISSEEIGKGLFNTISGYKRHIDFTEKKTYDDVIFNKCHIDDMVYTLDCGKGSLLSSLGAIPKEYTLLFSVYTTENKCCDDIIFSAGNIALSVERDDFENSYALCLDYGKARLHGRAHLSYNKWTDIALVQNSGGLTLYSQGQRLGTVGDFFDMSDKEAELGIFGGYINGFTIFDRAMDREELNELVNTSPRLFDDNVIYYCDFSDNIQSEMRKGIPLEYKNSDIVLVRGTNAGTDKPSEALPSATGDFDDFEMWEIKTLSRLTLCWLYNVTGVYPERGVKDIEGDLQSTPEFDAFFYDRIAKCPEAQKILFDYDELSGKRLVELMGALAAAGALAALVYYVYKDAKICKAIITYAKAILAAKETSETLFYALVIAAAVLTLAAIGQIPRPPKRQKKHTDIYVEEIKFENTVIDIDGDKAKTDVWGVIAANSRAKLRFSLSCKGGDSSFTIKTASSKDSIIKSAEKKVLFTEGKAEFTLDVLPEGFDGKYGKCEIHLKLSAVSSDSKQYVFIGETDAAIYILENAPQKPWSKSVKQEVLELCGKCHEHSKGSSKGFLADYAEFIKKQPDKGAGSPREYSYIADYTYSGIVFDTAAFSKAIIDGNKTSPADKVFSIAMLGALNGYGGMKALCLSSDICCEYSGKSYISKLLLNNDTSVKSENHYVVTDSCNKVYDTELGSNGLPFSSNEKYGVTGDKNKEYYRESLYMEGSLCNIVDTIEKWYDGKIQEQDIWEKQYNPYVGVVRKENGYFIRIGRSLSDRTVQRYIGILEYGQQYCHSISACDIEEAIAYICNNNNLREHIYTLLEALYPNMSGDEVVRVYYRGSRRMADSLNRLIGRESSYINNILEHFCYLAVNSPCNLRIGDGKWNASVGECFDPKKWFFVQGNRSYADERGIDNEPEDLESVKLRYGFTETPSKTGFYLPDVNDGIRIHNMRSIYAGALTPVKQKYTRDADGMRRCFIASSSNSFSYEADGDKYRSIQPPYNVYYMYNNHWTLWA